MSQAPAKIDMAPGTIWRATAADAELVNDWVWRDSGKRADFTQFLENALNVCLICGEGGIMFVWRGPGVFECHAFYEQRGREALDLTQQCLDIMRQHHKARMFWAAIPVDDKHVILFTRWLGWKYDSTVVLEQGACQIFSEER